MGFGSRGRGTVLPWIFVQDTDIVDRARLNSAIFHVFLLFFGLFSVVPNPPPSPGRGLIVLFSVFFCYFPVFFSLSPPRNFSADALAVK